MSYFQGDAIFWVEIDKVKPNPYQPRTEFNEERLRGLADSIRQYGVLQPLVVTRHEEVRENGGMSTYYELIAGERRLRASKLAGLLQIPVTIRSNEEHDRIKLELAIIENLQREDLNAIDRAHAFARLAQEFKLNNTQIAKKVGKSRVYVSNSLRLLNLPEDVQGAVTGGKISEGHARALLMLIDRPEEQMTLFRDIMIRKLSVRDVEKITRHIAVEKVRRKDPTPEITAIEYALAEKLGTRVEIKQQDEGGRLIINFFSTDDLKNILSFIEGSAEHVISESSSPAVLEEKNISNTDSSVPSTGDLKRESSPLPEVIEEVPIDDRSLDEQDDDESDSFSVKNFSI